MKKVEKAVTVEELESTTSQVKAIHRKMAFAPPLSPSERQQFTGVRIGAGKLQILQNRLAAAKKHSELIPPGFDLEQFERDVNSTVAAFELVTTLKSLLSLAQDTVWVLGHRAAVGGQTVHTLLKAASTSAERLQPLVGKIVVRKSRGLPDLPEAHVAVLAVVQPATPAPAETVIASADPNKKAA